MRVGIAAPKSTDIYRAEIFPNPQPSEKLTQNTVVATAAAWIWRGQRSRLPPQKTAK